jgi:hypothetical protein
MQGNANRADTPSPMDRIGKAMGASMGARLADVSAEIAAAGGSSHAPMREGQRLVKANNLGLIGVTVKGKHSGRELDIPVSLELYEDLDAEGLQTYLSDAARRLGACEPVGETHRLYVLPDSY